MDLNAEQKKAVEQEAGPLLIIAGAGTGKTTVITEKIKWLITKKGVPASQILALTFTEKAAREMEERVDKALPLGYSLLWISTFHSFCDRVLRDEAPHIGLNPNFKLMTEAETILFLRKKLFEFKLNYFRPVSNPQQFLKALINHFSRLHDEDINPQQYLEFAKKQMKNITDKEHKLDGEKTLELAKAFSVYQKLKEKEGVFDFADLISYTLKLFRTRPNILREYKNRFKYILVDEFQDTNISQYELIKLLAPPETSPNLSVTGDDSQSVYKFRGAAVSNILVFMEDYKNAKTVVLTKNYRSTQTILDKSYQLIKCNDPDTLEAKLKIPKNLKSVRGETGKDIKIIWADRVENEAETVAEEIKDLTTNRYSFKDIAILVRANDHSEPFARALARYNIPYQFLGPGYLFRKPEIKDLIAYLRLLADPQDDIAFFRVASMPSFDISARDLAFLRSFAKRENLSLFEAAERQTAQLPTSDLPLPTINKLVTIFHKHLKLLPKESGGQVLYYFLHDSGLIKTLLSPKTERQQETAINIAKFFDKIKNFEAGNENNSAFDLLDWINLRMELGESPLAAETDWGENDAINILTVHSAKGLEFPVVFLVNLVNQRFPTTNRREQLPIPQTLIKEILPEGDPHEQEERRLFYVAMTRAKDRLYFTAAKFYGEAKLEKKLSPFVTEALGDKFPTSHLPLPTSNNIQLSFLSWQKDETPEKPPVFNTPITYLSFSQIDSFAICPLQYKYKYLLRLPTLPSPAQTVGEVMHRTLKEFFQSQILAKEILPKEKILEIFSQNWKSTGFKSKAHENLAKEGAKKTLGNFYDKEIAPKRAFTTVALEQPFSFKITPNLKVGGVIDRVDILPNNEIEIIDYKTGKAADQKAVNQSEQLTVYALAVSNLTDFPFTRPVEKIVLSLYFLNDGLKLSSKRTKEDLENFRDKLLAIAAEIEKSEFPPKPSSPFPCDFCKYKLLCEAWR